MVSSISYRPKREKPCEWRGRVNSEDVSEAVSEAISEAIREAISEAVSEAVSEAGGEAIEDRSEAIRVINEPLMSH